MRWRLLALAFVLAAALADGGGQYTLAYYVLVAAVPVAAVAALSDLGALLDGSPAEPLDRGAAVLSALALPMLLLTAAVRAPLVGDGAPPRLAVTALVTCLCLFALQTVLAGAAVLSAGQPPVLETD